MAEVLVRAMRKCMERRRGGKEGFKDGKGEMHVRCHGRVRAARGGVWSKAGERLGRAWLYCLWGFERQAGQRTR